MNFIELIIFQESVTRIFEKIKRALFPEKPEKGLRGGVMNNQQGLTINPYW
jgi:hypothetical protein